MYADRTVSRSDGDDLVNFCARKQLSQKDKINEECN